MARLPRRWGVTKPPPGSQINWGHPLALGLVDCVLFNEQGGRPRELATGETLADVATGAIWSPRGRISTGSPVGGFTGSGVGTLLNLPKRQLVGALTVIDGICTMSTSTLSTFGDGELSNKRAAAGNSNVEWGHLLTATGGGQVLAYTNNGSGYSVGTFTYPYASYAFVDQAIAMRRTSGTSVESLVNGRSLGAPQTITVGVAGSTVVNIGGIGDGEYTAGSRIHQYHYMWSRALSNTELQWLAAEPYAFIMPPTPRLFIVAGNAITAVTANAAAATGTGTAYAPSVAIAANAACATGTGSAGAPSPAPSANAGCATGTVTAYAPSIAVAAKAGVATGTGAAGVPAANVQPNAACATGTGQAFAPAAAVSASAGAAAGTGTAYGATSSGAGTAGAATGTGAASNPKIAIAVNAGVATGTGTAYAPTVSTSSSVTANAAVATGTGSAYAATAAVAPNTGIASGTGAAHAPLIAVAANAGRATGAGQAFAPTATPSTTTTIAAGVGAAYAPRVSISVNAAAATGTGAAFAPVVSVGAVGAGIGPFRITYRSDQRVTYRNNQRASYAEGTR